MGDGQGVFLSNHAEAVTRLDPVSRPLYPLSGGKLGQAGLKTFCLVQGHQRAGINDLHLNPRGREFFGRSQGPFDHARPGHQG